MSKKKTKKSLKNNQKKNIKKKNSQVNKGTKKTVNKSKANQSITKNYQLTNKKKKKKNGKGKNLHIAKNDIHTYDIKKYRLEDNEKELVNEDYQLEEEEKELVNEKYQFEDDEILPIIKKMYLEDIEEKEKESSLKSKKKRITIFLMAFLVLIILILISVKLIPDTKIPNVLEVNTDYKVPNGYLYLFGKKTDIIVKPKTNLELSQLGKYKLTYDYLKKYKIKVVDTTKPIVKLNGDEIVNIYYGDIYKDEGITYTDNYDTLTEKNVTIENNIDFSKVGNYGIKYTVTDNSNNASTITRNVNITKKNYIYPANNDIEEYIIKNKYDISVGYYNLKTKYTYYYKPDKLYYGASLAKTVDALYIYDKEMVNDYTRELVKKAITVSDNDSHHKLIKYIGRNNIREYAKSLGANNFLTYDDEDFGFTNVKDQIAIFQKLYDLTNGKNAELKAFFLNTRKNCLLFDNSPLIMHKYGHYETTYNNSGIVLDGDDPYIVVVLTYEGYDNYQEIIKHISELVYKYHTINK